MKDLYENVKEWLTGIGSDKYLHVLAGLLITQVAIAMTGEPWAGFIIGVVAGILKETVDENNGGSFDFADLFATALGACLGIVLVIVQ